MTIHDVQWRARGGVQCARGVDVSHILAEKRGVSFTLFQKMHENAMFSPIRGEARTRRSATDVTPSHCANNHDCDVILHSSK